MVIVRSWPAIGLWLAAALLAWLGQRGKYAEIAAFCGVLCISAVVLLILLEGGTLLEGLACLLPVLFLMLSKETRHEL